MKIGARTCAVGARAGGSALQGESPAIEIPPKPNLQGIYAARQEVRDTIDRCLDDKSRNWTYAQIAALVAREHSYRMSESAILYYRRKRLSRQLQHEGAPQGTVVQITVPAGVTVRVRKRGTNSKSAR